jgi:hypothetical protein
MPQSRLPNSQGRNSNGNQAAAGGDGSDRPATVADGREGDAEQHVEQLAAGIDGEPSYDAAKRAPEHPGVQDAATDAVDDRPPGSRAPG